MGTEIFDVDEALKKIDSLQNIKTEVDQIAIEREDVTEAVVLGLLSKQHVFLLGAPGTAKSMSARLIAEAIKGDNVNVFIKQMTRQMDEASVFGPLNIQRWRNDGVHEYNLTGGLAEAHVAVLEEYYDASDATIRSMNELLNEREFSRNMGVVKKCPLHSAIATSNFWRDKDDAQAVADRFLIRVHVYSLEDRQHRVNMIKNYLDRAKPKAKTALEFSDIKELHKATRYVDVPDDVIDAYEETVSAYRGKLPSDFFLSDRRIAWAATLIRASAVWNGRGKADFRDIAKTAYGLTFVGEKSQDDAFNQAYNDTISKYNAKQGDEDKIKAAKTRLTDARNHFEKAKKMGDNKKLLNLHNILTKISNGFAGRKSSGVAKVDDAFKELERESKKLAEDVQESMSTETLQSAIED